MRKGLVVVSLVVVSMALCGPVRAEEEKKLSYESGNSTTSAKERGLRWRKSDRLKPLSLSSLSFSSSLTSSSFGSGSRNLARQMRNSFGSATLGSSTRLVKYKFSLPDSTVTGRRSITQQRTRYMRTPAFRAAVASASTKLESFEHDTSVAASRDPDYVTAVFGSPVFDALRTLRDI